MSSSDILRITSGTINGVNDALIGTAGAPNGGPLRSHFAGQLGKTIDLNDDDVVYNAATGTVYGGRFQYVRLAAASTAVALGQIVFWDNSVANNLYQVTTTEGSPSSTLGSTLIAGIVLNPSWTPGNYGIIQILGTVAVKFIATLTVAGTAGCPVYAGNKGAGVDNGLADVITTDATSPVNARFLGKAVAAPTNGGTSLVDLAIAGSRF